MPIRTDRPFFLLLVLCGFFFLTNIGSYEHFLRAESNFALGARDMLETGEFLLPHASHELPLNKPPLQYWLIGLSYSVLGYSHGASRVPAALCALGVVALVYFFGCRLRDRTVGLTASAMLATSYMFWSFARLAMPDILLTLAVGGTLTSWTLVLTDRTTRPGWLTYIAAASMALGFLVKGPLAVALCLLPVIILVVVSRDLGLVRQLRPVSGALVFLLVASPYFLLVYAQHGLEPLRNWFLNENLQRFTGSSYETTQPLLVFETTAFLANFAPWSLLLAVTACTYRHWRGTEPAARRAVGLLVAWLVAPLLIFSVSRFKLDYYFLTSVPPAALLVALTPLGDPWPKGWPTNVARAMVGLLLALPVAAMVVTIPVVSANFAGVTLRWLPHLVAVVTFLPALVVVVRRRLAHLPFTLSFHFWAAAMAAYLVLVPQYSQFLPARVLAARVPPASVVYTSARANVFALDIALYLPTLEPVGVLYGDTDNSRLREILVSNPAAVALIYERDRQDLERAGLPVRVLAQAAANTQPQLTGGSLRRPALDTLYLVTR